MRKADRRNRWIILGFAVTLLGGIVTSFALGRYPISVRELGGILLSRIFPVEPFWTPRMETVLLNIRLPRILLACLVGCSLSAAGASFQGIFQNPMASPDILGASSGAAFGAALAILLDLGTRMVTAFAFLCSIVTVGLVWMIGQRAKGKQVLNLVLSGMVISSLFTAGTSFIKLVADPSDQLPAITYWLMGSLAGASLRDIAFAFPVMLAGYISLLLLRWRINLLTMGDEEAQTMGVNTRLVRFVVIVSATLITATAVSVSGTIGWVGLVIPHVSRKLVGNNYRHLMPLSMLLGALFLLLVDTVARNLLTTEIPLGILTAFIGAPFFLYLLLRGGDGS
ncbi:iron ABC transporter permease [Eubacteriales bacterium OttesenSCG-928-A19]|nr:iron ABC transporter permease [Eubacteriales bacterium OttesenSCG-928-A19]